ncbi:hypothetical protein [Gluconobacter thailandicus]|uniref:Secreted protein n=1 Tax=Gluconobacter thailandicus TaxID=257438 RepID=A0AAP9JJX9_GLUTH|nr:hypothetical protein [Gluconobacter thailandicus]QEH97849.1 hypothetical protein FXF46_16295 [Gluconobacter thailandicus]
MSLPRATILNVIVLCLGTSWCSVARAAAQPCTLKTAEFCWDTNQLVWSPGFDDAIKRFVGPHKGEFATLQQQVLASSGDPPDRPVEMLGYTRPEAGFSRHVKHTNARSRVLFSSITTTRSAGWRCSILRRKGRKKPRLDLILGNPEDTNARDVLAAWAN